MSGEPTLSVTLRAAGCPAGAGWPQDSDSSQEGPFEGRSDGMLVSCVAPFAAARTGQQLREGVRNRSTVAETQIVSTSARRPRWPAVDAPVQPLHLITVTPAAIAAGITTVMVRTFNSAAAAAYPCSISA